MCVFQHLQWEGVSCDIPDTSVSRALPTARARVPAGVSHSSRGVQVSSLLSLTTHWPGMKHALLTWGNSGVQGLLGHGKPGNLRS